MAHEVTWNLTWEEACRVLDALFLYSAEQAENAEFGPEDEWEEVLAQSRTTYHLWMKLKEETG